MIFGDKRVTLGVAPADATIVPAAYLVFEVEGEALPPLVTLDNRATTLVRSDPPTRGHFVLDAHRSVGFHQLLVAGDEFFFGTEDAKLRHEGILSILRFLEQEGLGWGHQLFFADGSAIRHPKVDYAWLTQAASRIVELAREIAAEPARRSQMVARRESPRGNRVLISQTLSLLRREQLSRTLEPHPAGAIQVAGRGYWPRTVVAVRRERTFDTVGNLRATRLLLLARDLAYRLTRERTLPAGAEQFLKQRLIAFDKCLELFPFVHLKGGQFTLSEQPAREEWVDDRYRGTYSLWRELIEERCWEPGLEVAPYFAYVIYADQIYQAFVACLLAQALEAPKVVKSLMPGLKRPCFRSSRFEVFYDTTPPRPEFTSWRDSSSRPADLSPDVTIVDRELARGLLADAKYRVDDAGNLPGEAILEAQVYLQSFNRRKIAICYPGAEPKITQISGDGNTVLAISLGPFQNLLPFVRDQVRPALEAIMEPIGL